MDCISGSNNTQEVKHVIHKYIAKYQYYELIIVLIAFHYVLQLSACLSSFFLLMYNVLMSYVYKV